MKRFRRRKRKLRGLKSGLEVQVQDALKKKYKRVHYEMTRLTYTKEHHYTPDFTVQDYTNYSPHDDADWVYVEAKGRFTSIDRTKMLAVKRSHPDKDIRLVFARNNYLYKGSKTRYLDWCKEHGFPASIYPELPL